MGKQFFYYHCTEDIFQYQPAQDNVEQRSQCTASATTEPEQACSGALNACAHACRDISPIPSPKSRDVATAQRTNRLPPAPNARSLLPRLMYEQQVPPQRQRQHNTCARTLLHAAATSASSTQSEFHRRLGNDVGTAEGHVHDVARPKLPDCAAKHTISRAVKPRPSLLPTTSRRSLTHSRESRK